MSPQLYGVLGGVALALLVALVRRARGMSPFPPDPPPAPPGATWWQAHPGFKAFLAGWAIAAVGFALVLSVSELAGGIIMGAGLLVTIAYKQQSDWRRPVWPPWPFSELSDGRPRARPQR